VTSQTAHSSPQVVQANGVDLCVQTFGRTGDPAILLNGGAASSMDWWEEELCEQLAGGGRYVVRYDLRDTGQSVTSTAGEPDYGGDDLVADALGVLDALWLARAHVVGISMGGGIALRLALDHADRVASLTLLSTSPGAGDDGLPGMSQELAASFAKPAPPPDWSDREAVVDYTVESLRPFAGPVTIADADARALAGRIFDRTLDIQASMTNHWILGGGGDDEPLRSRLGSISVPTLVFHGTDDPLFPFPHGEAMAAAIPGASLVPLRGVGHEYPPRETWRHFVPALLAHTAEGTG
jgi:pimeloyl-ACP methyl ester carboxylesterase